MVKINILNIMLAVLMFLLYSSFCKAVPQMMTRSQAAAMQAAGVQVNFYALGGKLPTWPQANTNANANVAPEAAPKFRRVNTPAFYEGPVLSADKPFAPKLSVKMPTTPKWTPPDHRPSGARTPTWAQANAAQAQPQPQPQPSGLTIRTIFTPEEHARFLEKKALNPQLAPLWAPNPRWG